MSEHTRVKGFVVYDHLPYRENGFSYCKHCKNYTDKLEVCFNEGWLSDWMQVNCGRCGKAIWVASFRNGQRKFIKDDKKCAICGKPTNHYDCVASGGRVCDKTSYWCSRKCYNEGKKRDMEINFFINELLLDVEEQGLKEESDFNFRYKIAKEIVNG
jgi:hypothetical protein